MDIETFSEYYIKPISLGKEDAEAPLPQIFKDVSLLKISPDEVINATRKKYTFTNKNLDIITVPHEAYIYVRTTNSGSDLKNTTNTIGIPSTTGLIDAYDYMLNDTTICTQNNSLASTLHAVNNGLYATSSKSLEHFGLSDPNKGPINIQIAKKSKNTCEWMIPLKFFVPFLKENKILWGVKQTLKITMPDIANVLYNTDGSALGNASVAIQDIELRMPYVKLENNKHQELWSSLYSKTAERYWLDVDQFWSMPYDNKKSYTNETFKVATKGLNSKPRYLLLHAVDSTSTNNLAKNKPMGFGTDDPDKYNDATNTFRLKKLRVKLNGIYIDNGDVMEFSAIDAGIKTKIVDSPDIPDPSSSSPIATMEDPDKSSIDNSPYRTFREYFHAYDDYCKFFGQYYSKRDSVKSFNEWLQEQLFVIDLQNIDGQQIFETSGNALIIEVEFSTYIGTSSTSAFKLAANVLYDKQLRIEHNENKAVLTLT
jgi:hypothetical protein